MVRLIIGLLEGVCTSSMRCEVPQQQQVMPLNTAGVGVQWAVLRLLAAASAVAG